MAKGEVAYFSSSLQLMTECCLHGYQSRLAVPARFGGKVCCTAHSETMQLPLYRTLRRSQSKCAHRKLSHPRGAVGETVPKLCPKLFRGCHNCRGCCHCFYFSNLRKGREMGNSSGESGLQPRPPIWAPRAPRVTRVGVFAVFLSFA